MRCPRREPDVRDRNGDPERVYRPSIPVGTGIAILRYRLYDIDLLINRTLVYAALTGMLVSVYVGGVVLFQALFRVLTGGESTLALVAFTLAIAALFNPLRRRIQAFRDRRFYRKKYNGARTLEAFSVRLREETELDVLERDLLGVIGEALRPEHASMWCAPRRERRSEEAQKTRVGGRRNASRNVRETPGA